MMKNESRTCETCGTHSGNVKWCPPCLEARFKTMAATSKPQKSCQKCRTIMDHGGLPGPCVAGRYGHTGPA